MILVNHPSSFRILTSTKNFVLRYSVSGQVLAMAQVVENPFHVLQKKLLAKYEQNGKQLVIVVTPTKKAISNKAVVRNTISRRIREAAIQELRKRGFKPDGRVIGPKDKDGVGIGESGQKKYPLVGCLVFFPYEDALVAGMPQLQQEVAVGLDKFLVLHEEERVRRAMRDRAGNWGKHAHEGRQVEKDVYQRRTDNQKAMFQGREKMGKPSSFVSDGGHWQSMFNKPFHRDGNQGGTVGAPSIRFLGSAKEPEASLQDARLSDRAIQPSARHPSSPKDGAGRPSMQEGISNFSTSDSKASSKSIGTKVRRI